MKLTLEENKILKDCFETIGTVIDEIVLECDSEGMRVRSMDRSHITFVGMELKKSLFQEYNCSEPEKVMIDATELIKIMKRCKPSDVLKLESDEDKLCSRWMKDYFQCEGTGEMGESNIQYLHGETVKEHVKSTFNIAKIKDMLKAKKLSSTVSLGLGDDMPLLVEFNINGEGGLSFLLAPRLEAEE